MAIFCIIEIITSFNLEISMFKSRYLFACRFLSLVLLIFTIFSCEDPNTFQASYQFSILSLGEDQAVTVSSNPYFTDFRMTTQSQREDISPGHEVTISKHIWNDFSGLFKDNRFPKSLDGLFILENTSNTTQRCFIYLNEGYPSKILKKDRLISPNGPSISDIIEETRRLLDSRDYNALNIYWREIHTQNSSIAIELSPKQKIHLHWQ